MSKSIKESKFAKGRITLLIKLAYFLYFSVI